MADKLPALQFYTGDWRKDPGVQALDYFERGVWFEILCIMHESDVRGKLSLNRKPMPEQALSRLLGIPLESSPYGESKGEPWRGLKETLQRLLDYGVASRDEDGFIVSRRMLRDEELRQVRRQSGHLGGNPKLCENYNVEGFLYLMERPNGLLKLGISKDPNKRLYKIKQQYKGEEIAIVEKVWVDDMGASEARCHEALKEFNHMGEWFAAPKDAALSVLLKEKTKANQTPSVSVSSSVSKEENIVGDKPPTCPHLEIVAKYHERLPTLQRVVESLWHNSDRSKELQARWRESHKHQSLDFWDWFFDVVATNPHWMGQNERGWKADLGWLVKKKNFVKVIERGVNLKQ